MNHDEKKYPPGTPVASLGDLQAVALAGLWVWSQKASKTILAADLLEEKGSTLAEHFKFSLIVWYAPPTPAVSDGPKKAGGGFADIMPVSKLVKYHDDVAEAVRPMRSLNDSDDAATIRRVFAECEKLREERADRLKNRIRALENDVANLKKGCIE